MFQPLRTHIPESTANHIVNYSAVANTEQFYRSTIAGAKKLRSILDSYEAPALITIGWSLGGMLALRLAADGLVDGAVIISAGARFVRPEQRGAASMSGWDIRQLQRMRTALASNRDSVEARFRSIALDAVHAVDAAPRGGIDKTIQAVPDVSLTTRWTDTALDAGLQLLMKKDLNSLLPSIQCPILIIHGADDIICPADHSARLLTSIPHAERLLLEEAGHAPFRSQPAVVSSAIRRWLHAQLS